MFIRIICVVIFTITIDSIRSQSIMAPILNSPADQSIDHIPNNLLSFNWSEVLDPLGDTVLYDFYLGESPDPPLFRSDLYVGWVAASGTEFLYLQVLSPSETYVEYLGFPPFLSENVTYYWKVVAKNRKGETQSSEIFSFTTTRNNALPTAPQLSSPVLNEVDVSRLPILQWTASTDADNDIVTYNVYLGTNDFRPQVASGLTDPFFQIADPLDDQQTYYWRVEAVDGFSGEIIRHTGPDLFWSFTIENYLLDAPIAGALRSPENGQTNTTFDVTFEWDAAFDKDGDAIHYDVYADGNLDPQTLIGADLTSTSFLYQFNTYGQHYWKVVAKDPTGLTDTSAVFSFTTWEAMPDFSLDMIEVTGGTFTMGQSDSSRFFLFNTINGTPIYYDASDENPEHEVRLDDFEIAKYEITNQQYVAFLNTIVENTSIIPSIRSHRRLSFPYRNVSYRGRELCQVFDATRTDRPVQYEDAYDSPIMWNGTRFELNPVFEHHPVRFMYYDGAAFFATWLGKGYRLPTEAEWEFAALGGNQSRGYKFSGSDNVDEVAVNNIGVSSDSLRYTQPVGSLLANELGIYDMTGNVQEVCQDYYSSSFYSNSPINNPMNNTPQGGLGRVIRGESFSVPFEPNMRIKARSYLAGSQYINSTGIRIVLAIDSVSYDLSGQVTDTLGNPLPGASITGFDQEVSTGEDGSYTVSVEEGWSGVIAAELSGYTFAPTTIEIDNIKADAIDKNFVGSVVQVEYNISGVVLDDLDNPLSGVTITGFDQEVFTGEDGSYMVSVEEGWSGAIAAELSGYTFTPTTVEIDDIRSDAIDKDFTGSVVPIEYVISGTIIDASAQGLKAITLIGFPEETTTDDQGYYEAKVPAGWSGIITPSMSSDYNFEPNQFTFFDVQEDQEDQNFQGLLITGIQDEEDKLIKVFPNPANGIVRIVVEQAFASNAIIEIVNLQGKVLKVIALNNETKVINWDVRDQYGASVPSGIYFCQVLIDQHLVETVKIVVDK